MKKLSDAIDRFCALHPRWGVPHLMRYIVAANLAIYILEMFSGGSLDFLTLDPAAVLRGEIWRVLTFALYPTAGSPLSLLISCVFYYWLGRELENLWGSAKFTVYYGSGVLLSALGCMLVYLIDRTPVVLAGAAYVDSALFFAYALYYPEAMVRIFYIIPVKMKWVAWFEAAMYAVNVALYLFQGRFALAAMPIVAMLNLFVFFAPLFQAKARRVQARRRPAAIEFRRAVKEQRRQQGYNHKCSVCGRTDTEFPELQFRYCSKCAGYHCFCQDHIFNHVHFTE